MGERGNPPPDAIPVFLVQQPAPKGIASSGLLQSLQREGISKGVIPDSKAQQVTDFVPVFDKSDVLSPTQKSNQVLTVVTVPPAAVNVVVITAPVDQILVIRSLGVNWGGTASIPDRIEIRALPRQSGLQGVIYLQSDGPFPISDQVIGDSASPITALVLATLPIALLPREILQIRAISPVPLITMQLTVSWLQELYVAPFRPAGL